MIAHIVEPGPTDIWNPVTKTFDRFDDVCMRCQSMRARHHSRVWVWWRRIRDHKRLRALRIGMDLTAHEHWATQCREAM